MTIFAPTDSAFEKLDPTVRSRLLQGEACVGSKSFAQTYSLGSDRRTRYVMILNVQDVKDVLKQCGCKTCKLFSLSNFYENKRFGLYPDFYH